MRRKNSVLQHMMQTKYYKQEQTQTTTCNFAGLTDLLPRQCFYR